MKARYFVVVATLALIGMFWQISQHRHYVSDQIGAINEKDQAGADISADQATVSSYVSAHMGTSTTLFLNASYSRAQSAAQNVAPQSNGAVYAQAQAACASHADSITQANCVQSYLAAHSQSGANPQPAAPAPDKATYTKTFTSPAWTPDSSGLLLLVAMVSLVLAIYVRMLAGVRTEY